jgi:hypothetical protein
MQFDDSSIDGNRKTDTFVQAYKDKFKALGKKYKQSSVKMPNVVYWNVRDNMTNTQAKQMTKNVQLYSGLSASLFKIIMKSLGTTPYQAMINTLTSERYSKVTLG